MWNVSVGRYTNNHYHELQDRFVVRKFAGGVKVLLCDGHGDDCEAVDTVAANLWRGFKNPKPGKALLARIRKRFAEEAQRVRFAVSGTTATLAFVFESRTVVSGIVGDSLIVCATDKGLDVSPVHNVTDNASERAAVEARGGFCARGYAFADRHGPGLQVTRALGDGQLHAILSREPELWSVRSDALRWVAVMTDGVLDTTYPDFSERLERLKTLVDSGKSAQEIVETFFQPKEDDATLVLLCST